LLSWDFIVIFMVFSLLSMAINMHLLTVRKKEPSRGWAGIQML
jgi:hypothetical protein